MNSSSAAKENKSNVIYGKIYGSVPYQIKPKLKRANSRARIAGSYLSKIKTSIFYKVKKNVPYEAPSNQMNHLYLKSSWGISVGLREIYQQRETFT